MAGRGVFSWVVRDSLSEEVIFEIRHEGREGTSHGQRWSRSVPGGGSCRLKDPSMRDKRPVRLEHCELQGDRAAEPRGATQKRL